MKEIGIIGITILLITIVVLSFIIIISYLLFGLFMCIRWIFGSNKIHSQDTYLI